MFIIALYDTRQLYIAERIIYSRNIDFIIRLLRIIIPILANIFEQIPYPSEIILLGIFNAVFCFPFFSEIQSEIPAFQCRKLSILYANRNWV